MPTSRREMILGLSAATLATGIAPARAAESGVPPPGAEHRVAVQGGSLYVRVNGDLRGPRPPLLMAHGGPGGALWQFFPALPLVADRAVVLYDQLDSGRSDAPGDPRNWTVDRFASEIGAIRKALGLEQVHLLGHSWGGIVATRYAASRPPGLRSLILQGTPTSAASAKSSVDTLLAALPDDAGAVIQAHERAGTLDDPAYARAMGVFVKRHLNRTSVRNVAMPYMAPTPEDRGDALAAAMTGSSITQGFSGVLAGFDDTPLLPRIAAPTLLMCGTFDIMTPAATRAVLPRLRQGSFREIADAGHMIQFDQPAAWRQAIAEFTGRYDA